MTTETHAARTGSKASWLLGIGTILAVALSVLVWPASWVLAGQAQSLQLIAPFDDATVGVNRFSYEDEPTGKDADIIAIYGTRFGEPEQVLFVDEDKVIRPVEKPELALLKKGADENPLQLQTVRFFTRATSIGAAIGAILLFGLRAFLRRRRKVTTTA